MLSNIPSKRTLIASVLTLAFGATATSAVQVATTVAEQDKGKPNIVVIFGADIGY
ncbi:hypothetical protein [Aeromonas enteropelogenes]|uniref:hypothetical protein n=1 Tax=Aeromonas enteropelogenes TaxID=29489 RepID=UPI0022859B9E|nr:hypothetical protein [Aeromonas enteropelogenes]MCZ0753788.1 hypothetical protein [Aeromonas enteropelogenes]